MKQILYPGTFDPITNGHVDLAVRTAALFDRVLVAIAEGGRKSTLFSQEERTRLAREALQHLDNVEVCQYSGLLVDFAAKRSVYTVLRGVRNIGDFEYEAQLASMNRAMLAPMDTLFLTPAPEYSHISSTLIREIAQMDGDPSPFVPETTAQALRNIQGKKS